MIDIQKQIITTFTEELRKLKPVSGLVLIGSSATDMSDKYSDLDFWVTVKDGHEKEVIKKIETLLNNFGELDIVFSFPDGKILYGKRIFHIAGTPPWHKIEVAMAPLSQAYVYTKGLDAPVKVLISKNNAVRFKELDKTKFNADMVEKANYLKQLYEAHRAEIEKYCLRRSFLEAYQYYETYALQPLIGYIRAAYSPTKQGFYLKHIYKDLKPEYTQKIEALYKVSSVDDIFSNLQKIDNSFNETV